MGSNAADIAGGTFVPHNFTKRRNDEYVWIGIMPGMMGTLMPAQPEHGIYSTARSTDLWLGPFPPIEGTYLRRKKAESL
jgi:hypothetical protein